MNIISTTSPLKTITPEALQSQLKAQNILLIDVREAGEFARDRIAGAQNYPLSTLTLEQLPRTDKTLVLYCQSSHRSRQAADKLVAAGLKDITHLEGGLSQWQSVGLPLVEDKTAPLPMMRQVQIVAGSLVLMGTLFSVFISPWFLLVTGFVGSGLIFAGVTGFCGMAKLLAKLPYNRGK